MFNLFRNIWRSKKGAEERAKTGTVLPKEQRADMGLEEGCMVEIKHDMLQLLKSDLNFHYSDASSKIQAISHADLGVGQKMIRAYTDGDHYLQVIYTGKNEAANVELVRFAEYQELTEEIPGDNKDVIEKWAGILTAGEYELNGHVYNRAHEGVMEFTESLKNTDGQSIPLNNQVAVFERIVTGDIYEYIVVAVETDCDGNDTGSVAVAIDLPKSALIIT